MTVAALYVHPRGAYANLRGVDPWDETRDARKYKGPHRVVAHPPCTRWCRLAGLVQARWGYRIGDDGGTFRAALRDVRKWGGVLEHPAYSLAWAHFDLARPDRHGGWSDPDKYGGRTCHVEQGRYGHRAKKATWLYAIAERYPRLRWGSEPDATSKALISWCGNHVASHDKRERLSKYEASATPPEFRAVLLKIARSS